eukprot:4358490-Pyramimonas_sp.AAC.1
MSAWTPRACSCRRFRGSRCAHCCLPLFSTIPKACDQSSQMAAAPSIPSRVRDVHVRSSTYRA